MFGFMKKCFFVTIKFFRYYVLNVNSLKCASINNQECRAIPEIISIDSNELLFYPYSIKTNKYSGSCNDINDPFKKSCAPDDAKDINVKVFNLMSSANNARCIGWHKTCGCKCRLNANICNNKQGWTKDKCRCEYKELIDKGSCDKWFIWNLSNSECGCDKWCDVGKYLNYKNCGKIIKIV